MVSTSIRSCPLCGRDNSENPDLKYSEKPWLLKQCFSCGLVYLQNALDYQDLEEDFAWERTFAEESETRRRRHPLLHKVGRLPKQLMQKLSSRDKLLDLASTHFEPGPVLDVGCAGGHTLANFPDLYIPYGIEVSHELSQIAGTRFGPRGGRVIQSDALHGLEQMPRSEFTGVIMTSFLEHEVNPLEVLCAARRVLQNKGRLIMKVPNYASWNRTLRGKAWCGFRFPDHVNYFTPTLLRRLVKQSGLRTVQFGFFDHLPTSDSMWLVAETTML